MKKSSHQIKSYFDQNNLPPVEMDGIDVNPFIQLLSRKNSYKICETNNKCLLSYGMGYIQVLRHVVVDNPKENDREGLSLHCFVVSSVGFSLVQIKPPFSALQRQILMHHEFPPLLRTRFPIFYLSKFKNDQSSVFGFDNN